MNAVCQHPGADSYMKVPPMYELPTNRAVRAAAVSTRGPVSPHLLPGSETWDLATVLASDDVEGGGGAGCLNRRGYR
jgi:hypothetical protein